jgi:RHS repeat-associated protein
VSFADINPFVRLLGMNGTGLRAVYVWDTENRLIGAAPPAGAQQTGDLKVQFRYDYLGRRVEKVVSTWNGSAWATTATTRYVWDGWRLLLEMNASGTITRKYTWGYDLAGLNGQLNSLEGAGTISGLLAVQVPGGAVGGGDANYCYLYDGNGNVGQLVDWAHDPSDAAGAFVAKYEYDPYGKLTASSGTFATANTFRFSTKQWDAETGLGYWGYRYYSAELGRWLSRDPIEEHGGMLLYGYTKNRATSGVDPLGREYWGPYDDSGARQYMEYYSSQMSSGYRPEPSGCCGPDITYALLKTIASFRQGFYALSMVQKFSKCVSMLGSGGWDVWELTDHGRAGGHPMLNAPGCGTGTCAGSVRVGEHCYRAGEVNYYLWGAAHDLCNAEFGRGDGWSLGSANGWTRLWRGVPSGVREVLSDKREGPNLVGAGSTECRVAWVEAGWYGDFSLVPANCRLSGCQTGCCTTTIKKMFQGHIGSVPRGQRDDSHLDPNDILSFGR